MALEVESGRSRDITFDLGSHPPGSLTPGETLRVYADLLPASDGTAPFSIHTFRQISGGDRIDPRQIAVVHEAFHELLEWHANFGGLAEFLEIDEAIHRTAERIGHDFEGDTPEHAPDAGPRLVH